MSEVFLNSARASELWAATKNLVASSSGGETTYTAGEGIIIENNTIGVTLPTKSLTLAEYDALSEEEKQADVQYIITDDNESGGGSPTLQGIVISIPPDKTSYDLDDTFDPTGMVVSAIYDGAFPKTIANYTISPDGPLDSSVKKITISYTENDVTVTTEQPISVTLAHIYGVTWGGTSSTKWLRTDKAELFADPIPYVAGATSYSSPFDNLMPWSGMVKEERTGGIMVAIPKFWYKLEQNIPGVLSSGISIKIADGPVEGFSVSPAHMDRGDGKGERDVVYVGRYKCSDSDYKSKTGELPKTNIIRATARTEIHNLGDTIWQSDFALRFTIWLLYLVEFADWNSQKVIGAGCGNGELSSMGYTDSMPYHTGTMQSSRDTYAASTQYRNIEGLWENAFDWCDGCYYDDRGLVIIRNPNSYRDNAAEGISVGVPISGFPSKFAVSSIAGFPVFFPTESNGNVTTYSCDYWSWGKNLPSVYGGGGYAQGDDRGLFAIFSTASSNKTAGIGSRLQELP